MINVDKIMKSIEDSALDKIKGALNKGVKVAVENTPSDSGYLKGQWQVNINGEPIQENANDPSGARTLLKAQNDIDRIKITDKIKIVNPADYAKFVNDGTEDTTGNRMEEKAALAIRSNLRN
jgi:hypothetical protein